MRRLTLAGVLVALAACAPPPMPRPASPACPPPPRPTADVPAVVAPDDAPTDAPADVVPADVVPADVVPAEVPAEGALRATSWCDVYLPIPDVALHGCRGHFLESHREGEGPHSVDEFELTAVAYGDLTGDGREDALVLIGGSHRPLLLSLGGPRPMGWVMLYTVRDGRVVRLADVATGDAPAVRASIARGVATVVRRRGGRDCAERWTWSAGELREGSGCLGRPAGDRGTRR